LINNLVAHVNCNGDACYNLAKAPMKKPVFKIHVPESINILSRFIELRQREVCTATRSSEQNRTELLARKLKRQFLHTTGPPYSALCGPCEVLQFRGRQLRTLEPTECRSWSPPAVSRIQDPTGHSSWVPPQADANMLSPVRCMPALTLHSPISMMWPTRQKRSGGASFFCITNFCS
jgi:hypothetical protein